MEIYIMLLRLIHIFAGIFWAGSNFLLIAFLQPTARATMPEGGKFMQKLLGGSLPVWLSIAAPLNVLAGLLLFWNDSHGLDVRWIMTGTGIAFTIGALAGIVGLGIAFGISRPTALALGVLGKEIAMAGKPPTPEQMAQVRVLQERMTSATLWVVMVLSITIAAMAVARYL